MDVYKNLPCIAEIDYSKYLLYEKTRFGKVGECLSTLGIAGKFSREICSRPLMIVCETINECTNDCIICPHGKMTRKKTVMPLEVFEKVLRDYSEIGGGYLSLTPKSGEVLLDVLLEKRLELVGKYRKIKGLSLTTNAVPAHLYSDERLKKILAALFKIQVSIYGLDNYEYKLMARRDNYDRMIMGIRRIIRLLGKDTTLIFGFRLLKKHTPGELKAWILDNFGVDIPFGYTYTYMDWMGALDRSVPLPFDGVWQERNESDQPCLISISAAVVFSNGDVSFCSCDDYDISEEFRIGNIQKESLSDIYNSEKTYRLWNQVPSTCLNCLSRIPLSDLKKYEFMLERPFDFIGA